MKFKFAFEVHSDVFATGTRYVCRMPGLVHVIADQGTLGFLFEYQESPEWNYINTDVLRNGWNTVSLDGDGRDIVLTVNDATYVILQHIDTPITFTGGIGKYVSLTETTPITNANSWSVAVRYKTRPYVDSAHCAYISMSGDTDNRAPSLINYDRSSQLRALLSSNGTSWNITTNGTGCTPPASTLIDLVYGFASNQYYLDYKLASVENYARVWTYNNSTKAKSYVPFQFLNAMDGKENDMGNHYNIGTLYIQYTKIIVNDTVSFDGNTARLGTDYINHNCVMNIDSKYPDLKTGKLHTYQSWLYLKNIQALKLED